MVRRFVDIAMAAALLGVAAPVILASSLALAISLRSWPFFVQQRVGRGGRTFSLVKLRTLPPSTPAYADKLAIVDVPRPAFADLLRRTHLDELPQLTLVMTGRMGLVGPRPEMPNLHLRMDADVATARTSVAPGCTGLWQVSVAADGLIAEGSEYDEFYLANRSLALDAWIVWRTVLLVLGLAPPVRLADVPRRLVRRAPERQIVVVGDVLEPVA